MTRAGAIPVQTVGCYAHRSGDDVILIVDVPDVSVADGPSNVRLRQGGRVVWPDTTVRLSERGVLLEARAPASALSPGVWALGVRPAGGEQLVPVQARLVVGRGQPIALLTGPRPRTEMEAPGHQAAAVRKGRRLAAGLAYKVLSPLPEDRAAAARARLRSAARRLER